MWATGNKPVVLALLALSLVFGAGAVRAATSADATIFNKATLTYSGGSAEVGLSVKVALVGATPTVSSPADASVTSGSAVEVLYTVTSNANGLDNYDLGFSSTETANNSGSLGSPTVTFLQDATGSTGITNLDLGGAVTAATNTAANQILIPAGAEVNLATDMYVNVVGFGVYKIDTSGNNGIVTGTVPSISQVEVFTQVNLLTTGDLPSDPLVTGNDFAIGAIAGGIQLGEVKQFRARVVGGAFTGDSTSGTHTITFSVNPDTGTAADATDDVVITVSAATVFLTKEVALVSGADGSGNGGTVGTYTTTEFDVQPGDVLSYRVRVGPASGQPAITSASIDDKVPSFTTYVTDSLSLNGTQVSTVLGTDGGTFPLDGGFEVNSVNSGINDGSGNDGTGEKGVIDAGAQAELVFRVIVQ